MPGSNDQLAQLQARVRDLERRLALLEGSSPEDRTPKPAPAPQPERLESKLGITLINRAGAVTLAIGILFFFKYAVDNRWIGAAGRIALGLAVGSALVAIAERLRKGAQQAFAQGVAACGIAVIYTAFYASFAYYHLWPHWVAAGGRFAACAFSFVLALRYNSPVLAALGTAGAICSVWMLLNPDHPGWLAIFVLVLAAVNFLAARSAERSSALRTWLLALGHACVLTAALRELNVWAVDNSSPDNRSSLVGESVSVFLALYAVAAIAWGILRRSALGRMLGLVLLLAVVAKLYVYDVWQLTRFYRISAFIALGVLLLAASYLYSRFRPKLEALWAPGETELKP